MTDLESGGENRLLTLPAIHCRRRPPMKKLMFAAAVLFGLAPAVRAENPVVVIETSKGAIKIELYPDKAPITVKNFLAYVDDRFYDNTIFHRVMGKENNDRDFMIQGGGFTADKKEKDTKGPIRNESTNGLSNTRGMLAMARTSDPNSATAQFYINLADNSRLDHAGGGYTVFGKVIDGMDVVDKIKAVRTGRAALELKLPDGSRRQIPSENVPVEDVVIKSVKKADGK
jgi:cyclophilin family peptidyl-prolyl cis-trans isomerase